MSIKKYFDLLKEKLMLFFLRGNKALERELYASAVTLKNLAIVKQHRPITGDYIIEFLMENSFMLRPVYSRTLSLYRSGMDKEALEFFAKMIGTKNGRTFSTILAKLDRINPGQLIMQMEVFQNMLEEQRVTEAMKSAERKGFLLTFWALGAAFSVILNFTIVVIFLPTLSQLQSLF